MMTDDTHRCLPDLLHLVDEVEGAEAHGDDDEVDEETRGVDGGAPAQRAALQRVVAPRLRRHVLQTTSSTTSNTRTRTHAHTHTHTQHGCRESRDDAEY